MNPEETKRLKCILQEHLDELSTELAFAIDELRETKYSSGEKYKPTLGDKVKVYAARADASGESLEGHVGIVTSVPDAKKSLSHAISVRIIERGYSEKPEYQVYPEQCVLVETENATPDKKRKPS